MDFPTIPYIFSTIFSVGSKIGIISRIVEMFHGVKRCYNWESTF